MARNFSQGDRLEVIFEAGRDGSPMTHVNGKVSFPERGGKLPKVGETWEVELTGTNPKGTVHFLRLIRRVEQAAGGRKYLPEWHLAEGIGFNLDRVDAGDIPHLREIAEAGISRLSGYELERYREFTESRFLMRYLASEVGRYVWDALTLEEKRFVKDAFKTGF